MAPVGVEHKHRESHRPVSICPKNRYSEFCY
jgi:hypothetical protein